MPLETSMMIIETGCVVFTGLVLGSFAGALTYRELRGISWAFAPKKPQAGVTPADTLPVCRSACPQCKTKLGVIDLVPVLSWLWLGGRCRHCQEKISPFYPLMELGVLAACLGVYAVHGLNIPAFTMMAAMPFLAALMMIDLRQLLLPNRLVGALALLGAVHAFYLGGGLGQWPLTASALSAGVIYGFCAWFIAVIMEKILQKEALGMGDVKFFAAAGLWLGLEGLPWFCMIAGISGLILGLLWRLSGRGQVFPFGPALIFSLYTLLLVDSSFLIEFTLK